MTSEAALKALDVLLAAYKFGGLSHCMWVSAERAISALAENIQKTETELKCVRAERARAQEACEQIARRLPDNH